MLGFSLEDLSMSNKRPKDKKKKKKSWYQIYQGFTKRKCREIQHCTKFTTLIPKAFFSVWNWVCFQIFALYYIHRYNIYTLNELRYKWYKPYRRFWIIIIYRNVSVYYRKEFWKDFYFYKNRNITYTKNFKISGIGGINQKETQKYWISVNLV
jgi:hypothetical protein